MTSSEADEIDRQWSLKGKRDEFLGLLTLIGMTEEEHIGPSSK